MALLIRARRKTPADVAPIMQVVRKKKYLPKMRHTSHRVRELFFIYAKYGVCHACSDGAYAEEDVQARTESDVQA